MGTVPHMLVYLCPIESEEPADLWLPTDKNEEKLTLPTPRLVEIREAVSSPPGLQWIPSETTMLTTNALLVGHVLSPHHHKLQKNLSQL